MKVYGNKHNADSDKRRNVSESDYDAAEATSGGVSTKSIVALILSALICVGTVWGIFANVNAANKQAEQPTETETQLQEEPTEATEPLVEPANQLEGMYNVLLAGTDDGDMQVDTLMILQMDTASGRTAMLSIPRESLIFGNYAVPKISAVYGNAGKGDKGAQALVLAAKDLVGFEVDGYILMSPSDLRKTVDELGGVDFDVPQDMQETDDQGAVLVDLEAGEQHLDGVAAIQLMRYRDYEDENTQRPEVQQDFVCALMQQFQAVADDTGLTELLSELENYMLTDLDAELLNSLAQQMLEIDVEQMQCYTLPGENVTIKGAEYYQLDEAAILKLINEKFNPVDRDLTKYDLAIRTRDDFGELENVPTVDSYTAAQQASNDKPDSSNGGSGSNTQQPEQTDPIPDLPPEDETEPTEEDPNPSEETDPETDPTDDTQTPTDPPAPTETEAPTDAPAPTESEAPSDDQPAEP